MTRRIVFHIGPEKTGTASVQHHFANNADGLRSVGLFYPTNNSGFIDGHHGLLSASYLPSDLRSFATLPAGLTREAVVSSIIEEIFASDLHTAIISSEFLSSRLDPSRVERLSRDFAGFECRVLVVVRPHLDRLMSAYSTAIRAGSRRSFEEFALSLISPDPRSIFHSVLYRYLRYVDTLLPWEKAFGQSVDVLAYPPDDDVVGTIFDRLRPGAAHPIVTADRKNESLTPDMIEQIRAINLKLPLYEELHSAGELDRWADVCRQREAEIDAIKARGLNSATKNAATLSDETRGKLQEIIDADWRWISERYGVEIAG